MPTCIIHQHNYYYQYACTTVLKEIIKYYLRGNSSVYCCLLDASKAFDKIHFGKLFKTLISKNLSPLIIRLILNSYIRQEIRVSWGIHMSSYFRLANVVKHGGVAVGAKEIFTPYKSRKHIYKSNV